MSDSDKTENLSNRKINIQELRGIAVISVVLFHLWPRIFPSGYLGVDLFFVISGFVVCPVIQTIFESKSPRYTFTAFHSLFRFLLSRFWRLFPTLLVTIMVCEILLIFFSGVGYLKNSLYMGALALLGLGNFGAYYFQGNYFSPFGTSFLHLWSLGVEEQIYFFIPLSILITRIFLGRAKIWKILVFVSTLSLLGMVLINYRSDFQIPYFSNKESFLFYSPFFRIWEFSLGGIIALKPKNNFFLKSTKGFLGVTQVLILFMSISIIKSHISLVVVFIILFQNRLFFSENRPLLGFDRGILKWIGDRSYSIYLIHLPVIWIVRHSPIFENYQNSKFWLDILLLLSAILSVFVGYLLNKYVEDKFRVIPSTFEFEKLRLVRQFKLIFISASVILTFMIFALFNNFWISNTALDRPTNEMDPTFNSKCYPMDRNYTCISGTGDRVLLLGDSHAGAISHSLGLLIENLGLSTEKSFTSGCILVSPSNYQRAEKLGSSFDKCLNYSKRVNSLISERKYQSIIVSFRSSNLGVSQNGSSWSMSHSEFKESVISELNYIKKTCNCNVLFIGPTPEFPDSNKFFSFERLIIHGNYNPPKKFNISQLQVPPFEDDAFYRVSLNKFGIEYISSINYFCSKLECKRFLDNWLYSDYDHLSHHGAIFFVNKLDKDKRLNFFLKRVHQGGENGKRSLKEIK